MKKTILLLSPVMLLLLSYTKPQRVTSHIVAGTVISEQTGKPVSNAHVYIVHGEEEALSDDKGFFKIESWQQLPVRVTVEVKDYLPASVIVSDISKRKTIRLKHR